ncbi:MAG: DNA polymerase III subunit epsilon [Steroidobacteraceae bacterium]
MRQIVLDTETTGLELELQHRIIEIGCVELNNRRLTGRAFHRYLNPERDIDEGALEVHGLTREQLAKEPTFAQIQAEFLDFVRDAELVIHNAPFDIAFLNAELARLDGATLRITELCRVLDTLALARQMHPGQRNSLDALCKRYSIDNSHREYHGALLDARILAEVYLAMTGGQATLILSAESDSTRGRLRLDTPNRSGEIVRIAVVTANEEEMAAHEHVLALLDKASGGKTVWRNL